MSVSGYDIHPYKALFQDERGYWRMMFPKECKMRSQHYPNVVASNGTFCWFKTQSFYRNPTYYPDTLQTYEIPSARAIDIDTQDDYEIAQKTMN
jgi:CMP-N-acetylneuraminic acid synthetase